MESCGYAPPVSCASHKAPIPYRFHHSKGCLSSDVKARFRNLPQIPALISNARKTIKATSMRLLDAFVDNVFEFVDEPYHPLQANFAPVDEIEEVARVTTTHGGVPDDFPEGVYVRNGANPSQGGLKSAKSIFGKTSQLWIEGEGMIHALYFNKDIHGKWTTFYNNKHVKTGTFKMEKQRKKTLFLPATEGNPAAVLAAVILNSLRVGKVNKNMSNTNVFEHAGKYYSISEEDVPQEIHISSLETVGDWDNIVPSSWNNRPFTSHPKKSPETGELIIHGFDAKKPYLELGVISADGRKLIHKVDLKMERSIICHEIGITKRYNVIMDFPLIIEPTRLLSGGSFIKFEKEKYARIGVMPRYGDADSVRWFGVETCSTFHIINCHEEDDEVVVMACRTVDSIIPGPDLGIDKFEWFSRGFKHLNSIDQKNKKNNNLTEGFLFARPYMWRLNMKNGAVQENYLTGTDFALDFPMINEKFTGLKNKYAYTQVVDSHASSAAGMVKYCGLAKLYLQERNIANISEIKNEGKENLEKFMRSEYHIFPENTYCTGSTFIPKVGAVEEDDGWLITFVHNEKINLSEVYIVDAKKFSSEPVARIAIPFRVPYGFHGAFMPIPSV